VGQFRIHHRRQVFPDNLSDIQTDHLKQLSQLLEDFWLEVEQMLGKR